MTATTSGRKLDYERIAVDPLTGSIGAEVGNVDLRDVDDETFAELSDAWMRYKVLFFRDQHLTPAQHLAYAARWGELEVHPYAKHDAERPEIIVLDSTPEHFYAAETWHSDVMFEPTPPLGSVLRADIVPPIGGDTVFANMELAYDSLSDDDKALIEGRAGVNTHLKAFGRGLTDEERTARLAERPEEKHPLARTHPVTGRRCVYTCRPFTDRVDGMDRAESDALLERLWALATVPQFQVRFRWRPGSVAQWDNRCTQHYAVPDYRGHRRRMERATIIGERPF